MSDIFEEVEEGLRQDTAERLWARFAPFVWGAGALIIAGVAAYELVLKPGAERQAAESLSGFKSARTALEAQSYTDAEAEFVALVEGGDAIAPLAAHYLSGTRFEGGGDAIGAAEALSRVASAEGGPLERLALLKSAYLEADQLSLADLETRLAGLVLDESAIGALAQELLAAKAFEEGDYVRARSEFNFLTLSPSAPQGVRRRADAALAVIPLAPEVVEEPLGEVEGE